MFYWKQIGWNRFQLLGPGVSQDFVDYDKLYRYCLRHGINAMVA